MAGNGSENGNSGSSLLFPFHHYSILFPIDGMGWPMFTLGLLNLSNLYGNFLKDTLTGVPYKSRVILNPAKLTVKFKSKAPFMPFNLFSSGISYSGEKLSNRENTCNGSLWFHLPEKCLV